MPKESKKFINPLLRPSQEAMIAPPQPQNNLATEVQTEEVYNGDGQPPPSEQPLEKTLPSVDLSTSTPTSTLPSTNISLETVIHKDMQSEVSTSKSRLRGKRSAPERTRDSAIAQNSQGMSMQISTTTEPVQEEKKELPIFNATKPLRRKRGPLAFEKTHERITLWIDKGLKQAFEELAYEQDLPKTALLNEAIADLLRKYDLR